MTLGIFAFLSAINIALLLFLIRKRGWTSIEGLCSVYLVLIVLSDNVEVFVRACFWPETLLLGPDEIILRIYPTVVHIIGIGAFLAGLTLVDPRPRPISRALSRVETRTLKHIGIALFLIGAAMHGTAIYRGLPTGLTTNDALYATRAEQQGAFLYKGANIALLGLVLLFACSHGIRKIIIGIAVLLTPVIAYFNKGGLERGILYAAVVCSVYQNEQFKRFFKSGLTRMIGIPAVVVAVVLVIGLKNDHRKGKAVTQTSNVFLSGLETIGARYSADGLYRGYCQMTTYMRDGSAAYFNGRILFYSLVDWLPGFIYSDKPDHPTRNTGYLVYSDHHSYSGDASAYTFVGMAYADFGVPSVVSYLLVAGVFLGLIRKAANRAGGDLYPHVGYLFVCLFGACSPESGFLDLIYTVMLGTAIMGLAWLIVHALFRESGVKHRKRWSAVSLSDDLRKFEPNARIPETIEHERPTRELVTLRRLLLRSRA